VRIMVEGVEEKLEEAVQRGNRYKENYRRLRERYENLKQSQKNSLKEVEGTKGTKKNRVTKEAGPQNKLNLNPQKDPWI